MRGVLCRAPLPPTLVVGVGNDDQSDDAAGLEVARRLARVEGPQVSVREWGGSLPGLLDAVADRSLVIVVAAAARAGHPGRMLRFENGDVIVYSIEGESFALGRGLSAPVLRAVRRVARLVRHDLRWTSAASRREAS